MIVMPKLWVNNSNHQQKLKGLLDHCYELREEHKTVSQSKHSLIEAGATGNFKMLRWKETEEIHMGREGQE